MKLATYDDGSRDGQLVVVSRDLTRAHFATGIVTRMQQLLDDWNFIAPQLQDLASALEDGKARHAFAFDPRLCLAPLPRAFHWACTAAPEGDAVPAPQPLPGHRLHGAHAAAVAAGDRAELALVAATGERQGETSAAQGLDAVRLLLLAVVLRPAEGDAVRAAFAPVALTPDEFDGWHGGELDATPELRWHGRPLDDAAAPTSATARRAHLGQRVAVAARSTGLGPGSLIGGLPLAWGRVPGPVPDAAPDGDDGRAVLRAALVSPGRHAGFGAMALRPASRAAG